MATIKCRYSAKGGIIDSGMRTVRGFPPRFRGWCDSRLPQHRYLWSWWRCLNIQLETNGRELLTCRWRVGDPFCLTALWSCGMWEEVLHGADAPLNFQIDTHRVSLQPWVQIIWVFLEVSWVEICTQQLMKRAHKCSCVGVVYLDMTDSTMLWTWLYCFSLDLLYWNSTWSAGPVLLQDCEWLMAYCLNDEVIAGFKKTSPCDILCIFEVKQAVKYMGYLPRLFMSLNCFPWFMKVWNSVWKDEGA